MARCRPRSRTCASASRRSHASWRAAPTRASGSSSRRCAPGWPRSRVPRRSSRPPSCASSWRARRPGWSSSSSRWRHRPAPRS
jgi:hypothetical protein